MGQMKIEQIAADDTVTWNSKDPEVAASFYTDVPDLSRTCDDLGVQSSRDWFDADAHARQSAG